MISVVNEYNIGNVVVEVRPTFQNVTRLFVNKNARVEHEVGRAT